MFLKVFQRRTLQRTGRERDVPCELTSKGCYSREYTRNTNRNEHSTICIRYTERPSNVRGLNLPSHTSLSLLLHFFL